MQAFVTEVCGTRESLIKALDDAQNQLQNSDTYELRIQGEGDAPDLTINFRQQTQEESGVESQNPWVRHGSFTE